MVFFAERGIDADRWRCRSLKLFGEGCAMPVTSFMDLPYKFDVQLESRTWGGILSSVCLARTVLPEPCPDVCIPPCSPAADALISCDMQG